MYQYTDRSDIPTFVIEVCQFIRSLFSHIWIVPVSKCSPYFCSNKDYDLALDLSDRAIALDPSSVYAQEVHENICCHLVERWHFIMLNDKFRNGAYEKAIIKGIDQYPGSVTVCDVGCGTGLLR